MGFLARRKAKKEALRVAEQRNYAQARATYTNVVDPASTALLYATLPASETPVDREEDLSEQADDTAVDDTVAVDEEDRVGNAYADDPNPYSYTAPEYEAPVTEVYSPSWESSSSDSSSYDSGSSYDSSSSSDSGSSSSFD